MIVSVSHTSASSLVVITLDDGTVWHDDAALPPDTDLRRRLAEWRAAGGVIAPYVAPPTPVPASVSAFQARAALARAGLLAAAQAQVDAMAADDERRLAWNHAQAFERSSPTIAAFATALGLSEQQVDNLFREAATITA